MKNIKKVHKELKFLIYAICLLTGYIFLAFVVLLVHEPSAIRKDYKEQRKGEYIAKASQGGNNNFDMTQWTAKVKVTVDSAMVAQVDPSGLVDYPVKLKIDWLPNEFFDPVTGVRADGGDIVVTKADETTDVFRQVYNFDKNTRSGEIWFEADALSPGSNTDFYIYYNGPYVDDYYPGERMYTDDANTVALYHFDDAAPTPGNEIFEVEADTVGLYRLNGDTGDVSGNNNHLTMMGDVTFVPGISDQAAYFDGDQDALYIDGYYGLTTEFTVEMFVRQDEVNTGYIMNIDREGSSTTLNLYARNDTLRFNLSTQEGNSAINTYSDINDSRWHYVAATFDGDNYETKVYFDGILVEQDTTLNGKIFKGDRTVFGLYDINPPRNAGSYGYKGYIDEIKISNTAKSYTNIRNTADKVYRVVNSKPGKLNGSSNGALRGQPGIELNAYSVEAADTHVQIPNDFDLDDGYTIEFWMKTNEQTGYPIDMIRPDTHNNGNYFRLANVQRINYFVYADTGSTTVSSDANANDLGNWTYVAATYDESFGRLYINGRFQNQEPMTGDANIGTISYIGVLHNQRDYGSYKFEGLIDELRISDSVRTPTEINDVYSVAKAREYTIGHEVPGLTTIGAWHLEGNANDSSPNKNNGTEVDGYYDDGIAGSTYVFDGDAEVIFGDIGLALRSFSLWMKPDSLSDTGDIINIDGTRNISLESDNIVVNNWPEATVYVDGVVSTSIPDTGWHLVVVNSTIPVVASELVLGYAHDRYFNGLIDELFLYDVELPQVDIDDKMYNYSSPDFFLNGLNVGRADDGTKNLTNSSLPLDYGNEYIGTTLEDITVRVTYKPSGGSVSGNEVSFLPDNGGSVSAGTVFTDGNGQATVDWTIGVNPGANNLRVYASGVGDPVIFKANGVALPTKFINVTNPSNGESWNKKAWDNKMNITWEVEDNLGNPILGEDVKIMYTILSTGQQKLIDNSVSGNSYEWDVPESLTGYITLDLNLISEPLSFDNQVVNLYIPSANTGTGRNGGGGGGGGRQGFVGAACKNLSGYDYNIFPDIGNHTFVCYVAQLAKDDVVHGYADGEFKPDDIVTRGQMTKFIVNAFKIPMNTDGDGFSDVPKDHTMYPYIQTLKNLGIVGGYSDGEFKPDRELSRDESTKFVVKAMENYGKVFNIKIYEEFPDVADDNVFYDYIYKLYYTKNGGETIIGGYSDGSFKPDEQLTRGQMSKIIYNSIGVM